MFNFKEKIELLPNQKVIFEKLNQNIDIELFNIKGYTIEDIINTKNIIIYPVYTVDYPFFDNNKSPNPIIFNCEKNSFIIEKEFIRGNAPTESWWEVKEDWETLSQKINGKLKNAVSLIEPNIRENKNNKSYKGTLYNWVEALEILSLSEARHPAGCKELRFCDFGDNKLEPVNKALFSTAKEISNSPASNFDMIKNNPIIKNLGVSWRQGPCLEKGSNYIKYKACVDVQNKGIYLEIDMTRLIEHIPPAMK